MRRKQHVRLYHLTKRSIYDNEQLRLKMLLHHEGLLVIDQKGGILLADLRPLSAATQLPRKDK